jgi:hypothetical protein
MTPQLKSLQRRKSLTSLTTTKSTLAMMFRLKSPQRRKSFLKIKIQAMKE